MPTSLKMMPSERRAVLQLAAILCLRMLGLFMVVPLFALYAQSLHGATLPLIGWAMGIYGLAQALCQLPLGAWSDHIGRKKVIALGLTLFIIGSLLAASAHSITLMIIARTLQGTGAIGSTVIALLTDVTRETQRSKAMAMTGASIGSSFTLALIIGPTLAPLIGMQGIFLLAAVLGVVALAILYHVPTAPLATHSERNPFSVVLTCPKLWYLYIGIFILHAIFTASFIALPLALKNFAALGTTHQWWVYTPTLLIAFIFSILLIIFAEKKQLLRIVFATSIVLLCSAEALLWGFIHVLPICVCAILLFFTGFSTLEALLPSLVSRTAPATRKGASLGLYSCAQFSGIFVGAMLSGHINSSSVFLFCVMLSVLWLATVPRMQFPMVK